MLIQQYINMNKNILILLLFLPLRRLEFQVK